MKVTFVKKAQKDIPNTNIKAGDSYYWWKFRFGGKHCSKTYPKRSQLTQSGFLSQLYDLQDKVAEFSASDKDDFDSFKDEILSEIDNLKEECESSLESMPEHLQESSSSGELLTERIDALQSWYDDIDGVECDYDEDEIKEEVKDENEKEEDESEEEYEARIQEIVTDKIQETVDDAISDLQSCDCGL
jgi:hypothetical protein